MQVRSLLSAPTRSYRCMLTTAAAIEAPHSSATARLMKGRCITADGSVRGFDSTAHNLTKSFGLLPRDLRLLATQSANLAARRSYFVFRFPPFTGIVNGKEALLIADNGGADAGGAGYSRELVQLATAVLERQVVDAIARRDTVALFEHRVLDAVLREDTVRKQERFARLAQQIEFALEVRPSE